MNSKTYFFLSRASYFLSFLVNNKRFPVANKKRFNDYLFQKKRNGLLESNFVSCFADKLRCKEFINNKLGFGFTVETISILKTSQDIENFTSDIYPFFIKPNHSSGKFLVINSLLEYKKNISQIAKWLTHDYFSETLAEEYYGVDKSIIVEPFIHNKYHMEGSAHCVKGMPRVISFINRFDPQKTRQSFDANMNALNVALGQPYAEIDLSKIECLDALMNSMKILTKDIDYVRADFYLANDSFVFGELTNLPAGAVARFYPADGEERFNKAFFKSN